MSLADTCYGIFHYLASLDTGLKACLYRILALTQMSVVVGDGRMIHVPNLQGPQ